MIGVALLPPVDAIVWLGHVPVTVMFDPATKLGVVVPVPPFATATMPVTLAAVPVVFWFSVGTSATANGLNVGTPIYPFGAAKM